MNDDDEEQDDDDFSPPPVGSLEVDCGIIGKLNSIRDSEIDLCFIKSLLASSLLLEKMVIHKTFDFWDRNKENYNFAKKLLKLRRASSIAEINLK